MSGIVGTSHSKSKVIGKSLDTASCHVRFNTSAGIDSSYNVSSMTDVGTGNWTVIFKRPMNKTSYVCVTMTQLAPGGNPFKSRVEGQSKTQCTYNFFYGGVLYDGDPNHLIIFGG